MTDHESMHGDGYHPEFGTKPLRDNPGDGVRTSDDRPQAAREQAARQQPSRQQPSRQQPELDQLVFRWDGNLGRQGTGITAVAHSCDQARADALTRELAGLLRVSGGDDRPSLVRTVTGDGEVALIKRWPTEDPGGRDSTACHVLIGGKATLGLEFCLELAGWSWTGKAFATERRGALEPVALGRLRESAEETRQALRDRVDAVRPALVAGVAEWLRDPGQRLSLLTGELPHWPTQNYAPAVILGLHRVFGDWLGQDWTFSSYDTSDNHPLRLMFVPQWRLGSNVPSAPLARVTLGEQAHDRARAIAEVLVERALPAETSRWSTDPPDLVRHLPQGARMRQDRRLDELELLLRATPGRPPGASRPERTPQEQRAGGVPERLHLELLTLTWASSKATTRPLREQLSGFSGGELIDELRRLGSGSSRAAILVLHELYRILERRYDESLADDVCAEVLEAQHCYVSSNREPDDGRSDRQRTDLAVSLFSWAVRPRVRQPRHDHELLSLFRLMAKTPTVEQQYFLDETVLKAGDGDIPDFRPLVWQRLIQEITAPTPEPPLPPQPPVEPARPPQQPPLPPQPPAEPPRTPTPTPPRVREPWPERPLPLPQPTSPVPRPRPVPHQHDRPSQGRIDGRFFIGVLAVVIVALIAWIFFLILHAQGSASPSPTTSSTPSATHAPSRSRPTASGSVGGGHVRSAEKRSGPPPRGEKAQTVYPLCAARDSNPGPAD